MKATETAFTCKMCGSCCEGKGGIVLSAKDVARLADCLRISREEFVARYSEVCGTKQKLRQGDDGFCIFFTAEEGCTVHEGKPDICRAWPFFRGNLIDRESFTMAKAFCPGINPAISHEDFIAQGMRYLEENKLLANDVTAEANALIL
ncbi:MAG: YkgJ family cysteine cluster protein [Desulfovibrionaceae bacterium]|nr:YkgJ family cysteine cluster protein [Desulfovibrionaceae bacterium]